MNRVGSLFVVAPLLLGISCGPGDGTPEEQDAGLHGSDASVAMDASHAKDSGSDARNAGDDGVQDASSGHDAGVADAGGRADSGVADAGGRADSGATDSGVADAGGRADAGKTPGTAQAGDITINPATTYQTMDGFGMADVWQSKASSTEALRTLLFDPDKGIGLTLLRIGIETTGKIMGDAAFVDGPEVVKHGGKVWAAPWSPPASSKDNNDVNNGGHLLTSAYDSWASTLAAFPAYYKQQSGVDLYALSAQNEPDWKATYESCIYDKTQMNNFIKVLGPKLAALNPPVKLLAAEPDAWSNLWGGDNYGNAILNDATVSQLVTVIATHDYDNANSTSLTRPSPPAGANTTHHVWQTEIAYDKNSGKDISSGLDVARGVYAAVTSGGVNGWVYWWTPALMKDGSASNPPKRPYALGNFSKFVRPGYVRVGISGVPTAVQIVPFVNPTDGTLAIVALNSGTSAQQVSFFVSGSSWPSAVTPHVTSESSNLEAGTAISVSGARFSSSLAAKSITTFVGKP
jgi:glucuronoarabinoxylan endo-1,4-beta-xylanase